MATDSTTERPNIEAIRQRAEAASPGPWFWRGNYDQQSIELVSHSRGRGRYLVMDFVRWGLRGVTPRFGIGMFMDKAKDHVEFEVCPEAEKRTDRCVYRGQISDIKHPDAQFIAAARQDIDDLLAYIAHLEETHGT